jgi:putative spermidine/putrescine transport system ATP-binding protein
MDEPLSNLDAKLRIEMRAEIRRIHNALGATTIYVTHDQEEALSLADRIVVLRDGEMRQVGAPEDLFARPDHLDVAEFMGFRNVLRGCVKSVHGDMALVDVGTAELSGRMRESLKVGDEAAVAIRPDDLHPAASNNMGLSATVASVEFRGREFYGFGATSDETSLAFRSDRRLDSGSLVLLEADPDRILVFKGTAS